MDITIVVLAAAVMVVPTLIFVDVLLLTLVDAPIPKHVDVLILTHVDAHTVTVTTIQTVKMMTN